jgi:hypothetical protein
MSCWRNNGRRIKASNHVVPGREANGPRPPRPPPTGPAGGASRRTRATAGRTPQPQWQPAGPRIVSIGSARQTSDRFARHAGHRSSQAASGTQPRRSHHQRATHLMAVLGVTTGPGRARKPSPVTCRWAQWGANSRRPTSMNEAGQGHGRPIGWDCEESRAAKFWLTSRSTSDSTPAAETPTNSEPAIPAIHRHAGAHGTTTEEVKMGIPRIGPHPSAKGQVNWFTGTVRIDPLFQARAWPGRPGPRHVRARGPHGVAHSPGPAHTNMLIQQSLPSGTRRTSRRRVAS